jgi:hypothetical protein
VQDCFVWGAPGSGSSAILILLDTVNAVDHGRDLRPVFDNDIAFPFQSVGNVLSSDYPSLHVVGCHRSVCAFGDSIDCDNGNSSSLSFFDCRRDCFRVTRIEDDEIDPCSNEIVNLSKLLSEVIIITDHSDVAVGVYFIFGLNSSCERGVFMFSLVIRFTPVSTVSGTFSPLDASSAVFTPS